MNHPLSSLACVVLAAAWAVPACKSDGATTPAASAGGTTDSTSATGGHATGGAIGGNGGGTGSGGALATGGATGAGEDAGGADAGGTGGGRTTSLTGGAAGATGGRATSATTSVGGSTSRGGATGTGGSASSAGLTLYYIRHAEVVANVVDPSEITVDNMDELTELGTRQIGALTTYLHGLGVTPDAVLVSPHVRTQRTIEPYLVAESLTGEVWMELAEASDKKSTGAPLPAAPKYYSFYKATIDVQNLVFRDPSAISFWQNDSYEAGLLMVTTAKSNLLERYDRSGKTIFVVGHAIAGQLLIGLLRGEDLIGGPTTTGAGAVYLLNTGVMRLLQDPGTGLFKLDGKNVNNPPTK